MSTYYSISCLFYVILSCNVGDFDSLEMAYKSKLLFLIYVAFAVC